MTNSYRVALFTLDFSCDDQDKLPYNKTSISRVIGTLEIWAKSELDTKDSWQTEVYPREYIPIWLRLNGGPLPLNISKAGLRPLAVVWQEQT